MYVHNADHEPTDTRIPPPLPPYNAPLSLVSAPCVLPAVSLITIIFLFAAFGPMRDVCGRIAVFEENTMADEGN